MIVSISGTGGTGKTSVAKLLAKQLKWKLIELNKLAEKIDAYIGYDKKRRSKIVSVARLKREIKNIRKKHPKKYENLIIEGLYAHELPADVVIVLRCKPEVLEHRLKSKYNWPTKIKENVEAEIIGLIAEEALDFNPKVYEIDTTKRTAVETVGIIKKILNGKGEKFRAGKIDWCRK